MSKRPENDPDIERAPEPSALQEAVWGLLEDAGAPEEILIQIDKVIVDWQDAPQEDSDELATYRLWNKEP